MTRRDLGGKAVVLLIAIALIGGWLVVPGSAHNSSNMAHNWRKHYAPLAKKIFYTKSASNSRFVNVGETASDANLLGGLDSTAYAEASHAHAGEDITSGTVAEARIAAALARDSEVFGIVTDNDGATSGLDADFLDGLSSTTFASAGHTHSGDDITSGTVDESFIDALMARVADVLAIVLAGDGSGSGLDADLLDGLSSAAFEVDGNSIDVGWFKETADSLASTATSERVVFTAPENITITDVFVEPAAALTASDTNYATIVVSRRDAGGGNKVTVASKTSQTSGSGGTGNWTAFGTVSLGSLSNTTVGEGKKLTIEVTKTGLGVALPVLIVQIEYTVD